LTRSIGFERNWTQRPRSRTGGDETSAIFAAIAGAGASVRLATSQVGDDTDVILLDVSLWRKPTTTLTPVRAATRSIVCSTYDPLRRQKTRAIHEGFVSRQFRAIQDPGAKKGSGDLRLRPAWRTLARFGVNRLEALKGDRDGALLRHLSTVLAKPPERVRSGDCRSSRNREGSAP